MKFATATNKPGAAPGCSAARGQRRVRGVSAFTLAEVLAAMMFMAIVIPVAVEALHIASVSGEVAVRKAEATRVADRILNESVISTNWNQYATGNVTENGREFRWTLRNEYWSPDSALQLLTAEVEFSAQGRTYSVRMNTLVNAQSSSLTAGGMP
jgi:hypothetical protein